MSLPQQPLPAKLVFGLLFLDFNVQRSVLKALRDLFGPMDFLTEPKPFTYTSYYDKEMGPGLFRQVGSFIDPVPLETLPDIKLATNGIESRFMQEGKRQVNIDPGLLNEERLILATGKNYTHRVYLQKGIYADLTLIYQDNAFQVLPWTYPDYRDPQLRHFLRALRRRLIFQRSHRLPRTAG